MGNAMLKGKDQISAYWRTALKQIAFLEFKLDRAICDTAAREMVIVYNANLNGNNVRATELMRFGRDGWQITGEAFYGAALYSTEARAPVDRIPLPSK